LSGTVIPSGSATTYYSHWIDLPIDDVDKVYNATMSLQMEYGHPDRLPTRLVSKRMNLELLPGNQGLHMLYSMDSDVAKTANV